MINILKEVKKKEYLILLVLMFVMILFPMGSAFGERVSQDSKLKDGLTISDSANKYEAISIKGFWDMFPLIEDTKADLVLTNHDESCGINCMSEFQICTYEDSSLVDDIKFLKLENDKWINSNIRSYQFYIKTNQEEYSVDDYEYQCSETGKITSNGTKEKTCSNVKVGSHKETRPLYEPYSMKEVKDAGCYIVKLEGQKRSDWTYDWQIETQGKLLSEWATWTGSTNTITDNLVSYYTLDDVFTDTMGRHNGTNTNTVFATGKIANGSDIEYDTGTYVTLDTGSGTLDFTTQNMTLTAWVKKESNTAGRDDKFVSEGANGWGFYIKDTTEKLAFGKIGVDEVLSNETASAEGQWYFLAVTYNQDANVVRFYINGTADSSGALSYSTNFNAGVVSYIGRGDASSFDGMVDEVGIWNRTLSASEISTLYNAGAGLSYPLTQGVITLNSPTNGQTMSSTSVTTNASATVTGGATLVNATLYDNSTGTWGARNSSSMILVTNELVGKTLSSNNPADTSYVGYQIFTKSAVIIKNVTYNNSGSVTCKIRDDSNTELASASGSGGVATFNYQTNNSTFYRVVCSGTGYNYLSDTFASISKTYINYTNSILGTGIDSSAYRGLLAIGIEGETSATKTFTNTYPTGSRILWNMQFCDSDGACGFGASNYTFSVDSSAPTISLAYPTSLIDYGKLNGSLQLNVTATDSNLANVFYDYNGTNVTIAGAVSGVYNLSNITLSTKKNITIYANDTAGNLNSSVYSWDYKVFENGRNYSATSSTTTLETFSINFTTKIESLPVIYLEYNGTEYLSTRTGTTTNHYAVNEIGINQSGSKLFRWKITYGAETIYTDYSTQVTTTVSTLTFVAGACGAGLSQVMNFTFANEENLSALQNATAKFNFKYGVTDSEGATAYGTVSNTAQVSVCINTSTSPTYQIGYGEVQYEINDYSSRRFYVFDTTRISNTTINTTLYSIPSADSTSFLLEVRSPELSPYAGVYTSLLRWYPSENEYRVVEMGKTDDKGQTVKKVKIEDVDYRIGIYYTNGSLIYMINPIRMVCLATPCSYTVNIPTSSTNEFDEVYGIEAEIVYSGGIFTLTYNDPSQNTDIMSLQVYKISGTSNTLVCESNGTSFTGILTCNVSTQSGTLKAMAIRTASPSRPIATLIIDTLTTPFTGTFGLFLQFIIIVTLAFLGIASPIVSIIMGLIALLVGVLIFKTISYSILIGISIMGGIIIHMMKRTT